MSGKNIWAVFLSVFLFLAVFVVPQDLAAGGQADIRILHVNDFHGFVEPHRPFGSLKLEGGIAYLASRVKQLRHGKPSLLLAAGDMMQGDNWANLFQGASVIELMNAMGFDAMVVGNHEFDFGQEVLQKRIAEADFPMLGANVQGFPALKPFLIKEVGGIKVAIIGIITPQTSESTHPRNVAGLAFASAAATVRKYLAKLKPRVDLVLVLSHQGYQADRVLAQEVPGIDVIVGGHSHTKLVEPVRVNDTIIVQDYEHARMLGVLNLTVKDGKVTAYSGGLEAIDPSRLPADPVVLEIVRKYADKVDAQLNVPVGETAVDLDGDNVRSRETNLGNLVADVVRQTARAEAAIINGGSIRTGMPAGVLTRKSVYKALPYQNYILAFKLTGAEIKAALEHGLSGPGCQGGRFPQVSGLSFSYRCKNQTGKRVLQIFLDGRPLEFHKEYTVATNDFLAAGGDGYQVFAGAVKPRDYEESGGVVLSDRLAYRDPGTPVSDAVIAYIQAKGRIAPAVEGRIKAID